MTALINFAELVTLTLVAFSVAFLATRLLLQRILFTMSVRLREVPFARTSGDKVSDQAASLT